jgi:hypothetical protein
MTTDLETYRSELLLALRLHDVPGARIAEALAEVESHVAETGERPQDAFGPAKEYADRFAAAVGHPGPGGWRGLVAGMTWSALVIGLTAAAGSWLLLDGVFAAVTAEDAIGGLSPVVAMVLGLVALLTAAAVLVRMTRRSADQVLDPRTGADMTPPIPRWAVVLMVVGPLLPVILAVTLALVAPPA